MQRCTQVVVLSWQLQVSSVIEQKPDSVQLTLLGSSVERREHSPSSCSHPWKRDIRAMTQEDAHHLDRFQFHCCTHRWLSVKVSARIDPQFEQSVRAQNTSTHDRIMEYGADGRR